MACEKIAVCDVCGELKIPMIFTGRLYDLASSHIKIHRNHTVQVSDRITTTRLNPVYYVNEKNVKWN